MSRYRSKAYKPMQVEDAWYHDPLHPELTVDGEKQVDTGLVDAKGNAIIRMQEPIGFGRNREWG